jgi:hypothetical protein
MNKLTLFYNPSCNDCEKLARITTKLDWLNCVSISTATPLSGVLSPGEIAILEHSSGKYFTGVYATRKVSLNVPAYYLYGLLLFIPFIKKIVSKNKVGCNGDTCDV